MMSGSALSCDMIREEHRATEAQLTAALLKLLNDAEAAVDRDRQATRVCLARATALLLADRPQIVEMAPRGAWPRWQVNRLVAYIDAHVAGPINSADLIALTRVSAGHFFRTFKATFGESPGAYIARRRIERAQELMLTTSEPLCQVALASGLCDQSHLTRLFRRIVGMTPMAWRREYARRQPIERRVSGL